MNINCLLTGLTIRPNDEFGVVFLKPHDSWSRRYRYPKHEKPNKYEITEEYIPFCPPFYGSINSAGSWEIDPSPVVAILEDSFKCTMREILDMVYHKELGMMDVASIIYGMYADEEVREKRLHDQSPATLSDYDEIGILRANELQSMTMVCFLKSAGDKLMNVQRHSSQFATSELVIRDFVSGLKKSQERYFFDTPLSFNQDFENIAEVMKICNGRFFASFRENIDAESISDLIAFNGVLRSLNKIYMPTFLGDSVGNLETVSILAEEMVRLTKERVE